MLLLLASLLPIALIGLLSGDDDPSAAVDTDDGDADVQKGGASDNNFEGDGGPDLLAGFAGDDTLTGAGGEDLLIGDTGDDVLSGGDGRDLLLGGRGEDLLSGGADTDLLIGGPGEDRLQGEDGDDLLADFAGSAEMDGGAGNDTLIGLAAGDNPALFDATTQLQRDEFIAAVEAEFGAQPDPFDRMLLRNVFEPSDEASFDTMVGGAGDDVLIGDRGDFMTGGAGADTFVAVTPENPDDTTDPAFGQVVRVQDFNPDEDRLELLTASQGDVEITLSEVDQGVMVTVDGTDTLYLPGLRADQVNVADIVVSRI
jgi:Ca2+-binding RTX toxin-like protein